MDAARQKLFARKRRMGICICCARKAVQGYSKCKRHLLMNRKYMRARRGSKALKRARIGKYYTAAGSYGSRWNAENDKSLLKGSALDRLPKPVVHGRRCVRCDSKALKSSSFCGKCFELFSSESTEPAR